jgi:DeoR/GlpR family transcriptional regulator of sugar metabolism
MTSAQRFFVSAETIRSDIKMILTQQRRSSSADAEGEAHSSR